MKCLIDGDLLRYEVGFGVEYKDEEENTQIKSFDSAVELLDQKIKEIEEETWATERPTIYLTGDKKLFDKINKRRIKLYETPETFQPNFREDVAKTKEYKGNRSGRKPFHFHNLTTHILATYPCKIAWGIEADDLISIDHRLDPANTIICSRDKDLRITPGLHFGWNCGKQEQFGPQEIDELGFLELTPKGIHGGGLRLFYSQLITGDTVDNIPGLHRKGPSFAYKLLKDCETEEDLYQATVNAYKEFYGEGWEDYLDEQANLLWIVRELDESGNPVLYKGVGNG